MKEKCKITWKYITDMEVNDSAYEVEGEAAPTHEAGGDEFVLVKMKMLAWPANGLQ